MERSEVSGQSMRQHSDVTPAQALSPTPASDVGAAPFSYVYTLGRVTPRFPSLGIEKEFVQAAGRANTNGLTDRQVLFTVLSLPANRYLARQMCWVFTIEGLETYIGVALRKLSPGAE
jgi:hypothetical protein